MADLSAEFVARWRSMHHIGEKAPGQFALIRAGKFQRRYGPITMLDGEPLEVRDLASLPGGNNPWHNDWEPTGDWMMLPNLGEVTLEKTFDGNGVPTATIQMENVVYQSIVGVLGVYHAVQRGAMSPFRGFTNLLRTPQQWAEVNEWTALLNRASQIVVFQGYGDAYAKTFTGLIDTLDMTSSPDHMAASCRNFAGPLLTEQRLFGRNKDPKIRPPVTFADRRSTDNLTKVSGGAKASSHDTHASHPANNVTKADDSYWLSQGHDSEHVTEWVQIRLKRGRYEDFYVRPRYAGMELFVSVYVKDRVKEKIVMGPGGHPAKPGQVNDVDVNEGWYDPVTGGSWSDLSITAQAARIASGDGIVPGYQAEIPYVKHWSSVDAKGVKLRLGGKFEVGDNTILRLHWRKLHYVGTRQDWRSGVERVIAYARKQKKEVKKNKWVLVDDVADVVKVVLMWAGFKEWEVESFGARIDRKKPWVFHQSDFFIDLINYVKSQGDYQFFMADPSPHDLSLGVPVFRHTRATHAPPADIVEVKDTDLLTGISARIDHSNRPGSIRARGKEVKKSDKRGTILGEDTTRRIMALYIPPWHRPPSIFDTDPAHSFHDANVLRHVVHYDNNLSTKLECKVAAMYIALQYSLACHTAEIEVPGYPGLDLDDQLSIVDEGTGLNTRLWTAHVRSTFTSGQQAKWTTQIGGSLLDVPDNLGIAVDYVRELRASQARMEPSAVVTPPKMVAA